MDKLINFIFTLFTFDCGRQFTETHILTRTHLETSIYTHKYTHTHPQKINKKNETPKRIPILTHIPT